MRAAKRDAIVATARAMFFESGYGATSMSAIAAAVGGSKTTLWTAFPSKQALFEAVVDEVAEAYAVALRVDFAPGQPIEPVLRGFGDALIATIQAPDIVELTRLVTGEARRFPELAQILWQRGPARAKARLTQFIEERMAGGELRQGDAAEAARQFYGMCAAGPHQMHVLGLRPALTRAERRTIVDEATAAFLRAWR